MANRNTLIKDVLFFLKGQISSNITDPISALRGSSSKFVMTSYPEREVKYPLITVEVNNIEESNAGMHSTFMDIGLTIEIRVWSKSVAQSDQITQQILDLLADIKYVGTGSIANDFHDFNVGSAVRVDEPGEGGTKSRIIQLSYQFFNL